ncbi:methylated-DNA--[protein]-cysteine S-methyltransferase [Acidisoma cellulosilyticum]|uniref:methylated-DNA--[protein]-cysteine S-methyltransferase n=1 Tax=Acidisoma cellulosilyticum TaxID=2802395 RepID=UPI001D0AE54C|nr:methylated-DNA--[protein]-cysteine S-methyltransferase [Acidisoma cellulosilyticum]
MLLSIDRIPSPVGEILLVFEGNILRALDFHDYETRMRRLLSLHYGAAALQPEPAPKALRDPLDRYFAGDFRAIDKIKTKTGGTEFQRQVWAALRDIPAGETLGYGKLAVRIGRPNASRAVGAANGANPIAIVVPCHRVIGASAALTGYGGGLPRKVWLLDHEKPAMTRQPGLPGLGEALLSSVA